MITVNYCGHDSHHPLPCEIRQKNGYSDWLLLLVKTDAWFGTEKNRCVTRPGMAILFAPGMPVHYGRATKDYNDDWLHFSMPQPDWEALFPDEKRTALPLGLPLYPSDFSRLSACMFLLCREFRSPGVCSGQVLDCLTRALLLTLAEEIQKAGKPEQAIAYHSRLSRLRTRIYNDPAYPWRIETLAAGEGVSLSHFQHLYKQFFGCSCRRDIIRARLELAQMHLRQSDMTVHSIASLCGYENELHFMRQFKKWEGMTPSQYRESAQSSKKQRTSTSPSTQSTS
ncbi:MAG: AraC family transcriptional regulator [Eubacteriales bacterium]|nr:AraC family transcriptional regulator [Eubacteriales bacterium]